MNTLVTPFIIINIDQSIFGGETKVPLNGKERGNDPLPLPLAKNPNHAYQMNGNVMAQKKSVVETNINTF